MRILYHHRTRATDAQRVHITEMAGAFRELGHSVTIVSLVRSEGESPNLSKGARPAGWQNLVRRIPFAYEIVQLGYNAIGIPFLLWKALSTPLDFIYERYSLFNFTGVFVAKLLSKPIVLEVNSPFALEQYRDGHIRAFRLANWTEKIICNAATHVIVVTESLRQIMVLNGVRPKHLIVMNNGVNLAHLSLRSDSTALRRRLGLESKVVIGFIGWFRNWHGLDLLIDAFYLGHLSSKGVVLLLVGDGPDMKRIRRQVTRLQIGDFIMLTGALPRSVVPEYLALFDIAVQPAANEYCCPMKLLEYMALAMPIVAPRQPNVQELLREPEEAILFSPGDTMALASALGDLVADPLRANSLGKHARSAIEGRKFWWTGNAERVVQLIDSRRARVHHGEPNFATTSFAQIQLPAGKSEPRHNEWWDRIVGGDEAGKSN
jgi:glycosyltransferase involved in cell wall biosynthesis